MKTSKQKGVLHTANFIRGLFGIIILLMIWEVSALYVKKVYPRTFNTILPTIEYVFSVSFPELSSFSDSVAEIGQRSFIGAVMVIGKHSLITGARVIAGTILGMLVGIGFGLLMAWNPLIKRYIYPIVSIIRPIPLLALIPLFILWFGGSEIGNLIYITFGISVMVITNTLNAVRNVPPYYALFAETLGVTRWQVFRTIIIPAIIPELMGGIKVALGLAWAITLGAELLAAQAGLGRILILSQYFMYTGRMIVIVILFAIYSCFINFFATRIGSIITRWKPSTENKVKGVVNV